MLLHLKWLWPSICLFKYFSNQMKSRVNGKTCVLWYALYSRGCGVCAERPLAWEKCKLLRRTWKDLSHVLPASLSSTRLPSTFCSTAIWLLAIPWTSDVETMSGRGHFFILMPFFTGPTSNHPQESAWSLFAQGSLYQHSIRGPFIAQYHQSKILISFHCIVGVGFLD